MDTVTQVNYATLTNRGFNTRAGALGFGLIAAAGVVTLGFSLASGDGGFTLIFGLAFIIIGLLMAVAVWRGGSVALISGAVLSFLLLAVRLAVAHVIYGATLGRLAGRARAE